jgi:hypothetical protein
MSCSKFSKTEIMGSIFSCHNDIKPETDNRKKTEILTNIEIKQHAFKQPVGQRRNQKGNLKIA